MTKYNTKSRQVLMLLSFFKINSLKRNEVISNTISLVSGDHYYYSLTVASTGILTCNKWDGISGGKMLIKARKLVIQEGGSIILRGTGYRGGKITQKGQYPDESYQGESYHGEGLLLKSPNHGGGGGGCTSSEYGSIGGAGGGYGTPGDNSKPNTYGSGNRPGGVGGSIYGKEDLTEIYMGSGGGGGTLYSHYSGTPIGGAGGGILVIEVEVFENYGTICVDGENGGDGTAVYSSGGGGGSGGSILICTGGFINKGKITAEGGKGGKCNLGSCAGIASEGGNGGMGRIRIITKITTSDLGSISPTPFIKTAAPPLKIL
jgi:hypothetical protein